MKKKISLIVLALMLTLLCTLALTACEKARPAELPTEGLNYRDDGGYYTVTIYIETATETDIVIPSNHNGKPVKAIGDSAFRDCSGLKSITIPDSITSIGDTAFSGCSGLTDMTIPDSVTSIGYNAFTFCTGLKSVTIGGGMTHIGGSETILWTL